MKPRQQLARQRIAVLKRIQELIEIRALHVKRTIPSKFVQLPVKDVIKAVALIDMMIIDEIHAYVTSD